MGRAPTAKSKTTSSPYKKPIKTPAKRKAPREGSFESTPSLEPPSDLSFDKSLILKIIIAKLESSKTCDWFALAQSLGPFSAPEANAKKVKGKKGRQSTGSEGMSGTELHDLYHNVILPALKSGRALWTDDALASDLVNTSISSSPDDTDLLMTPDGDHRHQDEEIIEIVDEEEKQSEEDEGDGFLLEELEAMEKGKKGFKGRGAAKKQTKVSQDGGTGKGRAAKRGVKKYVDELKDQGNESEGSSGGEEYEVIDDDDGDEDED